MNRFGLLFVFLSFFLFAQAQDCFVSLQGTDSTSCGNITVPCLTIAQCLSNNPFGNGTSTFNADITMFGGIYGGKGNCGLNLTGFVSISNYNDSKVILDCDSTSRHFSILPGAALLDLNGFEFSGIQFANGKTEGNGGCIAVGSNYPGVSRTTINFNNCTFTNCIAQNGGAIYKEIQSPTYGTFQIQFANTSFQENKASDSGGALYLASVYYSIYQNVNFTQNSAQNKGGAIFSQSGIGMNYGIFKQNSAQFGGAIYIANIDSFAQYIQHSQFSFNSAVWGGAIYFTQFPSQNDITFNFNDVQIFQNNATYGGAIANDPQSLAPITCYFSLSKIYSNYAQIGGGLYFYSSQFKKQLNYRWDVTEVFNNYAMEGGGFYLDTQNDNNSQLFQLPSLQFVKNFPDDIKCSNNSKNTTFCTPCPGVSYPDCRACPSLAACVLQNSTGPLCYSTAASSCSHGTCQWTLSAGLPGCKCDAGWNGALCDSQGSPDNSGLGYLLWIPVVVGAILVIGIIAFVYYKKRSSRGGYESFHS